MKAGGKQANAAPVNKPADKTTEETSPQNSGKPASDEPSRPNERNRSSSEQ
jgi:hypothetical protein